MSRLTPPFGQSRARDRFSLASPCPFAVAVALVVLAAGLLSGDAADADMDALFPPWSRVPLSLSQRPLVFVSLMAVGLAAALAWLSLSSVATPPRAARRGLVAALACLVASILLAPALAYTFFLLLMQ